MRLDSCTRGIWRSLIVKIGRPSVRWQGLATLILATFPLVGRADNAPTNWQIGLPKPQSPIAESIYGLHYNLLMPIIIVITVFVLGLMLYTCWRFAEKRNPIPSKTTHNHTIEILWTVIPVLILVVIAVPSFRLLYDYHTI
nr:hypothetical protein [Alphaproteobacteria bacterium]